MPAIDKLNTMDDATRDEIGEVFAQYIDLIGSTVGAFVARYGGHYETLLTDANSCFLLCCNQVAPTDPVFPKKLKQWVWYGLFDDYRTRTGVRRQTTTVALVMEPSMPCDEDPFFDRYADLSDDAQTAIHMAIDPPPCLAMKATARGGRPQNVRSTLREHLLACGWKNTRISEAFKEVKHAL